MSIYSFLAIYTLAQSPGLEGQARALEKDKPSPRALQARCRAQLGSGFEGRVPGASGLGARPGTSLTLALSVTESSFCQVPLVTGRKTGKAKC